MDTMHIALNIRKWRERRGFTLQALATSARVTKGFLSQVENFRALPSIPLLYKIAEALELDPAQLLAMTDTGERYLLTRAGDGIKVEREQPESGFVYRALAKGKNAKTMEPLLLDIPPHAMRKPVSTNGDEFLHVLDGSVQFHLGDDIVSLHAGDSLYFEGEIPHYPENRTDQPARLLVVYSVTY